VLNKCLHQIVAVQFSCSAVSDSLWPHGLQAARQASLSITNSQGLLKLWIHRIGDTIQPSHQTVYLPIQKFHAISLRCSFKERLCLSWRVDTVLFFIDTELCFWPLLRSWPKFHLNFSSLWNSAVCWSFV